MKIARTIVPPAWMLDAKTQAVLNALDGQARFVGGCVRNALLDIPVDDIDLATALPPDQVEARLSAAKIKCVPTGIDHGTVTAVVEGQAFEITTLRKDVETDGRHAVVAFTEDWAEDAARRDFTMNTLLADPAGHIYDPTGEGLADLEAGRVRFVGEAAARIAEDYLRILRFFRFQALYGRGPIDPEGLAACRAAGEKIATLSKERITQEFLKILSVDTPVDILSIMFKNNTLKDFSFAEYQPELLQDFCTFQGRYGLRAVAARLLILAGFKEKNIRTMEEFILIPKLFHKDIQAISEILALPDLDNDQAVKVAVYKFGRTPAAQALMIELAQDRVMNGYAPKALEIIQNWDIPDFPVSGEDLIKQGLKPGPELGEKLAAMEEEWIKAGFVLKNSQ